MNVLVTGGAGYIGSVITEELIRIGQKVTVYDNLEKGHRESVLPEANFVEGDLFDTKLLKTIFGSYKIEAVIHMAAYSLVGESTHDPAKYYRNNLVAGLNLLEAMSAAGIKKLVFSSTAAVYGEPENYPIAESEKLDPTNPYGETKLAFERALSWFEKAYGLRYASLRYFNAAGASEKNGEMHDPETHLIPLVLQAALGQIPRIEIFGEDYPTRDGTCIRDYIHVIDLARAHVLALDILEERSAIYNLGCGGAGYTVREVIKATSEITGLDIPTRVAQRRPGDPAVLIADSTKIKTELGWAPEFQDLNVIIGSAWKWLKDHKAVFLAGHN
jgi:UDP-glucose 4-epimerase